jgi:phosphatidylinositol alpha-1,6-mannosyltransferase
MKILMLNNEFPPLGGGTGTVNQALFEQFAPNQDIHIDLITSALGKRYEFEQYSERIGIHKVPVNNRNLHHSSNRELITYAVRALFLAYRLQRENHYDFCFAWSGVPAGVVANVLMRFTNLKYILRVSGPDIPGFEKRYRWLYPWITPAIRSVWRGSEFVIAKCSGEADLIRSIDNSALVTLISNGVDLEIFKPRNVSSNGDGLHIICVGRLIERKGQRHLIQAVKQLVDRGVDLTLELVGTGDSEHTYRMQVYHLGLSDIVQFAGYVPREEIPEFYRRANIFVLPSINEGMSVATLEAMASGLPVVVSDTPGTTELVENGINGFIYTWGDVEKLVSIINYLSSHKNKAQSMGKASHDKAMKYSWKYIANRYIRLFQEINNSDKVSIESDLSVTRSR